MIDEELKIEEEQIESMEIDREIILTIKEHM